jgi:glutamyl-Q tRNA(Asp) synthetase
LSDLTGRQGWPFSFALFIVNYTGRFAPSPSGPLHIGSLVAAMASYLDARAHGGRWLLRIEDVDTPRTVDGAARRIMDQLNRLQMVWDGSVMWQSQRLAAYERAFATLLAHNRLYGCGCTRREIADSARVTDDAGTEHPYPGTCRLGLRFGRTARSWRLRVPPGVERFEDRWLGPQQQHVADEVGDFALKRADGLWAYQLAVVVDDAAQMVTDVVRGADLLGSTARQRVLGRLLRLPLPRMMHVPLVIDEASGLKLSKQNGALALDLDHLMPTLQTAWAHLGFSPFAADTPEAFWAEATRRWAVRFGIARLGVRAA